MCVRANLPPRNRAAVRRSRRPRVWIAPQKSVVPPMMREVFFG